MKEKLTKQKITINLLSQFFHKQNYYQFIKWHQNNVRVIASKFENQQKTYFLREIPNDIYEGASEPLTAGVKDVDSGVVKRNEQSTSRNSQIEKFPSRDGSSRYIKFNWIKKRFFFLFPKCILHKWTINSFFPPVPNHMYWNYFWQFFL